MRKQIKNSLLRIKLLLWSKSLHRTVALVTIVGATKFTNSEDIAPVILAIVDNIIIDTHGRGGSGKGDSTTNLKC